MGSNKINDNNIIKISEIRCRQQKISNFLLQCLVAVHGSPVSCLTAGLRLAESTCSPWSSSFHHRGCA